MAIETPLWLDPAPGQEAGPATSARQDRALIELLATEGVENVQRGDLAVTSRASGAAMSVEVAPGVGYVTGDDMARQGRYRVVVSATETKAVAGAPATGSRIDLVVLRVWDASVVGGANHRWDVEVVTGVAGDSPVAPAVPPTALVLARVRVAAGQASVQAGDITDAREQSGANTLRVGTAAIPGTTVERNAYTNPLAGQLWENITTGRLEHYITGAWRPVVTPEVAVVTSATVPAAGSDLVVSVPLGVTFGAARAAVFAASNNRGGAHLDVGTDASQTFGIAVRDLGEPSTILADGGAALRGAIYQGSGVSIYLTSAALSGSSLVLGFVRSDAAPAQMVKVYVRGRAA